MEEGIGGIEVFMKICEGVSVGLGVRGNVGEGSGGLESFGRGAGLEDHPTPFPRNSRGKARRTTWEILKTGQ